MGSKDNLVRDFERENHTLLDAKKQVKIENKEMEFDFER